jgi:hypothetical protein
VILVSSHISNRFNQRITCREQERSRSLDTFEIQWFGAEIFFDNPSEAKSIFFCGVSMDQCLDMKVGEKLRDKSLNITGGNA